MTLWLALILGLLQGLTEFLPVSSSGHLFLLWKVFNLQTEKFVTYAVCVHLATLLAVLTFLHKEILLIIKQKDIRLVFVLFVATVPAALVGILLKEHLENLPPYAIGFSFFLSGLFCLGCKEHGEGKYSSVTLFKALFVGAFQALAVLPGLSRSGSTLFASLKSGLLRKDAVIFSFLLSIPVIIGATLFDAVKIAKTAEFELAPLLIGMAASYISALFALKLLVRFLLKGRLLLFAFYLFFLSAFTLLYFSLSD
ncbi:MAG: undecaprenyl-diphosphate phosphatase [Planctomycetota bacterium]|nr:undecaprenyl-diphosphate phosphatase [Planctomycetota bacterium]